MSETRCGSICDDRGIEPLRGRHYHSNDALRLVLRRSFSDGCRRTNRGAGNALARSDMSENTKLVYRSK